VGFFAGVVGLVLSRLGLIWPDFDVFSHFTIHFLLWTLSFAIVPWFFRRLASTAAIATTVCLCALLGLWPSLREAQPLLDQSIDQPHLRVATYNIYKGSLDLQQVATTSRGFQADVLVLVEVTYAQRDVMKLLKEDFPHQLYCYDIGVNCDVAILSRYPMIGQTIPPTENEAKALGARIQSPIGDIEVFGFHSTRFPFSKQQFQQASDVVGMIETRRRPLVLMGDFNATPNSRTVNMIAENADLTSLNSLPTWPANLLPQLAIDHILISKDLEVFSSVGTGNPGSSDHLPLIVTLVRAQED
jgi:endonuclease/exonuclease/phosphatase (EEP) superfamily protein YafD